MEFVIDIEDLEMHVKFITTVETRNGEDYLKIKKIILHIDIKRYSRIFYLIEEFFCN